MENFMIVLGVLSLFSIIAPATAGLVYVFCPSLREDIKADVARSMRI